MGEALWQGVKSGAITGAILGGVLGGFQQGFANAKVTATGVGTKGNIWTGREIAVGRSAWALNNTPKPTTVGQASKGVLKIGDITVDQEITTYKIDSNTEAVKEVKSSYTRFINTEDGTTIDLKPTIDRIKSGVSFPHRNDGSVFSNFPPRGQTESLLPVRPHGFYKEFVVPTPGINEPGSMRMVTGADGGFWFTKDH